MPGERLRFPSGDLHLEGVVHTPSYGQAPFPGVVLCHPHPLYGGDMENNVVMAMVEGLIDRGIAALRFNFRGVGGSEGQHSGGAAEQQDVQAALEAIRQRDSIDSSRIGLAGYSFGAGMALNVAPQDGGIRALVLVAPPMAGLSSPGLSSYAKPMLFLVGDADSSSPIEQFSSLVHALSWPAWLEVIGGADHFLVGHEIAISWRVGHFFALNLKG